METNVFGGAWEILYACLSWFFPPSLLAQPIVALLLDMLFLYFGLWLLGFMIIKPIHSFGKWLIDRFTS